VKCFPVSRLGNISGDSKEFTAYCFQERLVGGVYQGMTYKTHKAICHHDEISASFARPEVMQAEPVNGKVMLEFFDAVFRVGSSPIRVIYHASGKRKIGGVTTIAVITRSNYKKNKIHKLFHFCISLSFTLSTILA
jgi:hypothetical protein